MRKRERINADDYGKNDNAAKPELKYKLTSTGKRIIRQVRRRVERGEDAAQALVEVMRADGYAPEENKEGFTLFLFMIENPNPPKW